MGPGAIDKVGARCKRAFSGSARDRVKSLNCLVSSRPAPSILGTYTYSSTAACIIAARDIIGSQFDALFWTLIPLLDFGPFFVLFSSCQFLFFFLVSNAIAAVRLEVTLRLRRQFICTPPPPKAGQ